jgi:hypothetical protein
LYEFPEILLVSKSNTLKLEILKFIIKHIEEENIIIKKIKQNKINEFIKPLIEQCLAEKHSELKKQTETVLSLFFTKKQDKLIYEELKNQKQAVERELKPILDRIFLNKQKPATEEKILLDKNISNKQDSNNDKPPKNKLFEYLTKLKKD